jgi:hypothetical protein
MIRMASFGVPVAKGQHGVWQHHWGQGAVGETGQDRKEVSKGHILDGRSRPRTVRIWGKSKHARHLHEG